MAARFSPVLDPRLLLAFDLYSPCELAADIGTDHAHLPAALLQRGRCQRMILTDISPAALDNARFEIARCNLSGLVDFRLGNGLQPISETCGVISVTGMGGRTIRDILLSGCDRLQGASLVLSAHTDWYLIRQTMQQIGYRLESEEPCFSAGRYYLVMRAVPGAEELSTRQIRLGSPLFRSSSPDLLPFLKRRCQVLTAHLEGLRSATAPDKETMEQLAGDISFLESVISQRG